MNVGRKDIPDVPALKAKPGGPLLTRIYVFLPILIVLSTAQYSSGLLLSRIKFTYRIGEALNRRLATPLDYNYLQLAPNYFADGFIRRGLLATLAALVGSESSKYHLILIHIISAISLAIPLFLIVRWLSRVDSRVALPMTIILLLSPQLFVAWSGDIGRSDMFCCGFIAWSVLAVLKDRFFLAALALFIGSLAHESAVVFGVPLCAALIYSKHRANNSMLKRGVISTAALISLLVAAAVAEHLIGGSPSEIARTVMSKASTASELTLAPYSIYQSVSGIRGLLSASCLSYGRPVVPAYLLFGFVAIGLYLVAFRLKSRLALLAVVFAATTPLIFMDVVAIDYGRWCSLAVMTAWLAAAGLRLAAVEPVSAATNGGRLWAAMAMCALFCMGPAGVFYPSYFVQVIAKLAWPNSPETIGSLDKCDPGWRSVLSQ